MDRFESEDDFLAWKHHHLNEPFLRYLNDLRDQLARTWASGVDLGVEGQATAVTLTDLIDLQYETIQEFYSKDEVDNEDQGPA